MPIIQDRLICLIEIIEELLSLYQRRETIILSELQLAMDKFYTSNGTENELACELLAHLQSCAETIQEPLLNRVNLELFIHEREHFRLRAKSNQRSARAMQRRRNQGTGNQ